MSGPVDAPADTSATAGRPPVAAPGPALDVVPPRQTQVGGLPVRRALPVRARRTVGAWCFVDLLGPAVLDERTALEVGPHPHTGLHTVTWLTAGAQVHRDSLGSEQLVRPGELNLMTAGRGVAHAEESMEYRGPIAGVQLWVAQPEHTRHGAPDFAHLPELPRPELDRAEATVLVGRFADAESKARADTPLLGVDLVLRPGATVLPLDPSFEHAVVVLEGRVRVAGQAVVEAGALVYLGTARDELVLEVEEAARVLLLGGTPFGEPVLMFWNLVARSREEVEQALADWSAGDERFGRVPSDLPRTPSPGVPWRRA